MAASISSNQVTELLSSDVNFDSRRNEWRHSGRTDPGKSVGRLLPCALYRRHQRLAGKVRGKVVDHELAHRLARRMGGARHVRLEHDVVQRKERFGHARLVGEDVEARAADAPFL